MILQNQQSVNGVNSIITCQLEGLNAAVSRLDAKINIMVENYKPEQNTAPPVYYKQPDQQQCVQQAPYVVQLTNQRIDKDHPEISRTFRNNNLDLY